jgi:hypothetical protein
MPLLNPSKDFDLNEKFDLNKYKIVLYLTKSLLYNALASLERQQGSRDRYLSED